MASDLKPVPGNEAIADDARLVCRQVVELLTAFLEGALTPEERRRVQAHLDVCGNCMRYLEQMRQTVGFLRGLGANGVTPEITQDLLVKFRAWCAPTDRDA